MLLRQACPAISFARGFAAVLPVLSAACRKSTQSSDSSWSGHMCLQQQAGILATAMRRLATTRIHASFPTTTTSATSATGSIPPAMAQDQTRSGCAAVADRVPSTVCPASGRPGELARRLAVRAHAHELGLRCSLLSMAALASWQSRPRVTRRRVLSTVCCRAGRRLTRAASLATVEHSPRPAQCVYRQQMVECLAVRSVLC